MNLFRGEFRKWGEPEKSVELQDYFGLTRMQGKTRFMFERHLPRGVAMARLHKDRDRNNSWMSPGELMGYRFEMGQLMLGKIADAYIGYQDDRPIVTIAGTRSGKTKTILDPNLYLYRGSLLALDPKGELARTAAVYRRLMGHDVYVLDAFGQSGDTTACYNVLEELHEKDDAIIDDTWSITQALVPETDGSGAAKFFNDSARFLLLGLILLTLSRRQADRHLVTTRALLTLSYTPLVKAVHKQVRRLMAQASEGERTEFFNANTLAIKALLQSMINLGNRFGRVPAQIGRRFMEMTPGERSSVFSTASVNTDFLDSIALRKILTRSDFSLKALRSDRPTTIFLCLPINRMEQHGRFLRMMTQMTCSVLERFGPYPRERLPILMVLEEFATLGHMKIFERAAAYFPGFGIQPWYIVQDLTQLKDQFAAYESFLGNAGLVQLFGNGDPLTIDYAARKLARLMAPQEIEKAFARENESQLLFRKGRAPATAMRLSFDDVARIRDWAERALDQRGRLTDPSQL